MTTTSINYEQFVAMLRRASALIKANETLLSRLDSQGGDGDHGTTMVRAMNQLEQAIDGAEGQDFKALCNAIAWGVMDSDGGSTGPLWGSLFMGLAKAAAGRDVLDAPALAEFFEAGLAGVQKRTKAQPGDKTMMDALAPAVAAIRDAADAGATPEAALSNAAAAAKNGAEATITMQAKFGRAKNLGEKSVGHQDPGATSVAFIFEGFSKGD
jgi:phosphoenolpyruvate---glycerone phosphotransferase subunit DhaL